MSDTLHRVLTSLRLARGTLLVTAVVATAPGAGTTVAGRLPVRRREGMG